MGSVKRLRDRRRQSLNQPYLYCRNRAKAIQAALAPQKRAGVCPYYIHSEVGARGLAHRGLRAAPALTLLLLRASPPPSCSQRMHSCRALVRAGLFGLVPQHLDIPRAVRPSKVRGICCFAQPRSRRGRCTLGLANAPGRRTCPSSSPGLLHPEPSRAKI